MKLNKNILILIILVIFMSSICISAVNAHKYEKTGYVTRVIDGDTIKISTTKKSIRLWGVDTPELSTAKGRAIKIHVNKLLLGKKVTLDIDNKKKHDKYGRILAKVYLNGKDINKWLLNKKYARVMYIPPSEFKRYTGGLTPAQFKKFTKTTAKTTNTGTSKSSGVYIAPYGGTKYHYDKYCKGLINAKSIEKIALSTAKKQGYTLCGWEK